MLLLVKRLLNINVPVCLHHKSVSRDHLLNRLGSPTFFLQISLSSESLTAASYIDGVVEIMLSVPGESLYRDGHGCAKLYSHCVLYLLTSILNNQIVNPLGKTQC